MSDKLQSVHLSIQRQCPTNFSLSIYQSNDNVRQTSVCRFINPTTMSDKLQSVDLSIQRQCPTNFSLSIYQSNDNVRQTSVCPFINPTTMSDKLQFVDLSIQRECPTNFSLSIYKSNDNVRQTSVCRFINPTTMSDKLQFVDLSIQRQNKVCRTLVPSEFFSTNSCFVNTGIGKHRSHCAHHSSRSGDVIDRSLKIANKSLELLSIDVACFTNPLLR